MQQQSQFQPQQPYQQPPMRYSQSQQQPQQQRQAQQFYDANSNPVSLPMVYDEYGNIVPYNPMPVQQQQQSYQMPPQKQLPIPPPPRGRPVRAVARIPRRDAPASEDQSY